MIAKTQYKNPFYWSGYVASGDAKVESKPRPAPSDVAAPTGKETFVTPRCFEIFMSANRDGDVFYSTFRLKIGGVVYRKQDSPGQVTYDLNGPGNSIVQRTSMAFNGGPRQMFVTRGEGRDRWTGTVTVQNRNNASSVLLRFGRPSTEPEKRQTLTLQGGPKLFPTLEIPESLPGPSAYTQASDTYRADLKLDRVAACPVLPSW
jgi:hypothetical protein